MVKIMAADDLVTQGARASATMILTSLNWINLVPTYLGLKENIHIFVQISLKLICGCPADDKAAFDFLTIL